MNGFADFVDARPFDARTGSALTHRTDPGGPMLGLIATSGGLWYPGAGGMSAQINFMRKPALAETSHLQAGASGGGADVNPSLSGQVIWLGGIGELGCADPDTGRLLAHTPVRGPSGSGFGGYVSGMSIVHNRLYAILIDGRSQPANVLIELTPPKRCGLH